MFKVFSKSGCPKCTEVKAFLNSKGITFETIDVVTEDGAREFLMEGGFRTVPQVFTEDESGMTHFGDCDKTIEKLM